MDAALGWIGDLVRYMAGFVPRVVVIRPYECYLHLYFGKHVRVVGPGILWWVPSLSGLDQVYTARQVITTPALPYETADGVQVTAVATCRYRIVDPIKWGIENYNSGESVVEETCTALGSIIAASNHGEVVAGTELDLGDIMARYGVEVVYAKVLLCTSGFHLINTAPGYMIRDTMTSQEPPRVES